MKPVALFTVALMFATGIGPAAAEEVATPPARIAVAGGALTEIVFALGHDERLVGIDTTSSWPEAARDLPQFGYLRRLSAEGVLSMRPDLLLASPDAGPTAAMQILEAAGLKVAIAPETPRIDDVADKIRFVGDVIGDPEGGAALAKTYAADLARVRSAVGRIEDRPRVLFILTLSDGAPLVGGAGTGADEVIREAGGVNAAAGIDGYKPMNREAVIAAAPKVILMTDAHSDRLGGLEEVMARPDIAVTPAGLSGRGATMDALLFLGMGPRAPEAVETLAKLIHPPEALRAAGL